MTWRRSKVTTMTPDERAATAREVLTEAVEHMSARDAVVAAHELAKLRDERYPAPAAPVTVTVNGYAFSPVIRKDETWVESDGCCWRHDDHTGRGPLFSRIAADAQVITAKDARIAELEREVEELLNDARTADDARGNLLLQTICRLPDVLTTGDWQEWLDAHRHQWLNDDRAFGGWIAERLSAHMTRVERERDEARRALALANDNTRLWRERVNGLGASTTEEGHAERSSAFAPAHCSRAVLDALTEVEALLRDGNHDDAADVVELHAAAYMQAATSQGEGLGAPASTSDEAPKSEVTGGGIAAASPAPIPLGAVVVVPGESGSPYTYSLGGWIASHGDPYPYDDDSPWTFALTALYRATHPVADRATVERVAQAIHAENIRSPWESTSEELHEECRNDARAALRALGYTIQEGT